MRALLFLLGLLAVTAAASLSGSSAAAHVASRIVAHPDSLPSSAPVSSLVTDQDVESVVVAGETVYAAGFIFYVGPRTGAFALLDGRTGRPRANWPAVLGGSVHVAISDGSGGWFVAGSFTSVGGRPCAGFARLTSSGRLDRRFCHVPNGAVDALARWGSTVYLGGEFRRIDGQPRLRLAAVDLLSGRLLGWRPPVAGHRYNDRGNLTYPFVDALAVVQGRLFAGGFFEQIGGAPRVGLAAFDAQSGALLPWRADASPADPGGVGITATPKALYVWGWFSKLDGAIVKGIGAVSPVTGSLLPWRPAVNGSVSSVATSGARTFLAGGFSRVGGVARWHVAAVDASTGALDPSFRPPRLRGVSGVVALGHALYLTGAVTRADSTGPQQSDLAALDSRSGRLLPWAPPRANAADGVLGAAGGVVAVGGQLTSIGGQLRSGLVAIDGTTGRTLSWAPKLDGVPSALAVAGDRLYVGGSFKHVDGVPRAGLAAFDLATRKLTDWAPRLAPYDKYFLVQKLAADADTVFVAGNFAQANGVPRERLAAFDAQGGALKAWNPGLVGSGTDGYAEVKALQAADGRVYLAGDFTQVGGVERDGVAELDALTGRLTPFHPAHDGLYGITALYRIGDTLYLGGDFSHLAGHVRHGLAAVDARTYALLPWAPSLSRGWVGTQAMALAPVGGSVGVVGDFRQAGTQPHAGVALIDVSSGTIVPWQPPADQTAQYEADSISSSETIVAFDGYVGGNADTITLYRLSSGWPSG